MVELRAIHEKMIEIATTGDAVWFEDNPDRRIRIRNSVPMEFNRNLGDPPPGMLWRTLVAEAQPGIRARQPIALPSEADIDVLGDSELFHLLAQVTGPEGLQMLKKMRAAKVPGKPQPARRG